jgi:S-adenosylmethionine hydrolase
MSNTAFELARKAIEKQSLIKDVTYVDKFGNVWLKGLTSYQMIVKACECKIK